MKVWILSWADEYSQGLEIVSVFSSEEKLQKHIDTLNKFNPRVYSLDSLVVEEAILDAEVYL